MGAWSRALISNIAKGPSPLVGARLEVSKRQKSLGSRVPEGHEWHIGWLGSGVNAAGDFDLDLNFNPIQDWLRVATTWTPPYHIHLLSCSCLTALRSRPQTSLIFQVCVPPPVSQQIYIPYFLLPPLSDILREVTFYFVRIIRLLCRRVPGSLAK